VTGQSDWEAEVLGEVEVDVEELRFHLDPTEVGGEVRHVEPPEHRPLDLGPPFASNLVEVGVFPDVVDRSGERTVAVEERRSMRDRSQR